MADALCGPSNPLQNFRKQTQLDRSLQQDRLGARGSAAQVRFTSSNTGSDDWDPLLTIPQGFRAHDPRTGSLDADLYAFEHGTPSPLPLQFQQPPPSHAFAPPPAAAGWAADFQKLHISSASTPTRYATPPQQMHTSWGADFVTLQRIGTPIADIKGKQVMHEPQLQGAIYNTAAYGQQPYAQPAYQPYLQHLQMPQQQISQDMQISDTDFEAAFQDALQHDIDQIQQEPKEVYNSNGIEIDDIPYTKQVPIGSDAINYVEQADRTHDQDAKDADDLARTAGELVNLVQHDQSDKMKNSQFLSLMRRIRDREVEVQNNDLHQTDRQAPLDFSSMLGDNAVIDPLANHNTETLVSIGEMNQDGFRQRIGDLPRQVNEFRFPDMNDVYEPTNTDTNYSSHDDEYPRSQMQALHPGGRWYPEQQSPKLAKANVQEGDVSMRGGVGRGYAQA